MLATTIHGPGDIRWEEVADPYAGKPTDVVVKVLVGCVCGSGLWRYRGLEPIRRPGATIGHECVGEIFEVHGGTHVRKLEREAWEDVLRGPPCVVATAGGIGWLAREHGLTPAQLALAFCYRNASVASTIIGVTSLAQLDECLDAWTVQLSPELLKAIDAIRWQHRDPAQ